MKLETAKKYTDNQKTTSAKQRIRHYYSHRDDAMQQCWLTQQNIAPPLKYVVKLANEFMNN